MGGIRINTEEQLDYLVNCLIDERGEDIDVPDDYYSKRSLLRALMNVRLPMEISEEFLNVQDEFLTYETLNKDLTSVYDIGDVKGKILLWQGDIVTLKADAIVNAANSKLLGCFIPNHNCIDNVIHSAAGLQLRDECNKIMQSQQRDEEIGKAKITAAYNLPSKYVIHTVGPAIPQGSKPSNRDKALLASCYKSCLDIASNHELDSIAFCCISTGVFNFPQKLAAQIAVETVEEYLKDDETSLNHIIFNVFDDESYLVYDESYLVYKELLFGDDNG